MSTSRSLIDASAARPLRRVVLVGAAGMLGRAFAVALQRGGVQVLCPSLDELDLASSASIAAYARTAQQADAIINCAAWTDVDGAETNEAMATRINGDALADLLALARACGGGDGCVLVNFGTDYVFSGQASEPYRVDEPLAPLNAYGRSKAAGERALLAGQHGAWLHVRTSWLYAPWGNNFVRTMRRLLHTKPSVQVVHDQRGRPTSAEGLVESTLGLLGRGARGIWHATDGGECTWCEFAQHIAACTHAPGQVRPCTSAEFPRPAKRPAYSVLDIIPTEALLGPRTHWKDALARVVPRLEP